MKNYYINTNNEKIQIIDKEKIDLSDKNIKEIHITSLNKCKELYLESNCLTEFNVDLPNIEYLDLETNNLKSFKADLPKIEYLDLENNKLSIFNYNLPNCKTLYLQNNDLSYKRVNNKSTFYI